MRIVLDNREFFVFKKMVFGKNGYYFKNEDNTLADKYFSRSLGRLTDHQDGILKLLSTSTDVEALSNPPAVVNVSYIEQMEELQLFLSTHFQIEIDWDFNFFAYAERQAVNKNKKALFKHYSKKIKIYFSWDQVLALYNDFSGVGRYDKQLTNTIDEKIKTDYINSKRSWINKRLINTKKYAFLTLKKKRRHKRGFFIDGEALVSLPQ